MKSATGVRAVPHAGGGRIELSWLNPPAGDFAGGPPLAGIRIVRRERTFPLAPDDGDVVYPAAPGAPHGPVVARFSDTGVRPLTTYYYTVFTADAGAPTGFHASDAARAAAFATASHGAAERLYRLLPAVHQRLDTPLGVAELAAMAASDPGAAAAVAALPPGLAGRGQLFRFLHAAASPLDLARSFAEGLPQLHRADLARPEFLPLLAAWVGWELDRTIPVFAQRSEIRSAPELYRGVGTVPMLRALVARYTGWHAQVAELAQQLARSNAPAELAVYAMVRDGGQWRGTDDAAAALGFAAGNREASGSAGLPAVLTGSAAGPFALRPGMELALSADGRPPVAVRFGAGDFAAIGAATAAEVAAVLGRVLSEVTAVARPDGRLELTTHAPGPGAELRLEEQAASLVALEGAPRGRLAAVPDPAAGVPDRFRLFHAVADPLDPATLREATRSMRGEPTGTVELQPQRAAGRVWCRTFRSGEWGEPQPLPGDGGAARGEPAAVALPQGELWAGWIEEPGTDRARLRSARGRTRLPAPARVQGARGGPFDLRGGGSLVLRGRWPAPFGVILEPADFADPARATAAEVSNVLNARLPPGRLVASVDAATQAVVLATTGVGAGETLEVLLAGSRVSAELGFGPGEARGAGSWGDEVDWSPPEDVASAVPGRHADLHALVDAAGELRLFWAQHTGTHWSLVSTRLSGGSWTPVERVDTGAGTDNREPCAALDGTGRIWLFWSRRKVGPGRPAEDDNWTLWRRVFDPGTATWGAEAEAIPSPAGRAADREPGIAPAPPGELQLFFRSDRAGGHDLWTARVDPAAGTVGVPAPVTAGAAGDHAPTPLLTAGGALWLLFRSDRSLSLSRVATRPPPAIQNRVTAAARLPAAAAGPPLTIRLPDTGTLRRRAGSVSVRPGDAARSGRRRLWDDLFAYTPERPAGMPPGESLPLDVRLTRGTIALYLSQVVPDDTLSQQKVERLRAVLERFLPIHARAVVVLAPRLDIEWVYRPGADIGESYGDEHPHIEYYDGAADSSAALAPDWVFLLAADPAAQATADHVSADPGDLTTLRRRSWFPPPL